MKNNQLTKFSLFFLVVLLSGCATLGSSSLGNNYEKAEKAYDKGRYEDAIKYYNLFLDNNPGTLLSDVSLYYIGSSYQNLGQFDKAKVVYEQLIGKHKTGYWVESAQNELKMMENQ